MDTAAFAAIRLLQLTSALSQKGDDSMMLIKEECADLLDEAESMINGDDNACCPPNSKFALGAAMQVARRVMSRLPSGGAAPSSVGTADDSQKQVLPCAAATTSAMECPSQSEALRLRRTNKRSAFVLSAHIDASNGEEITRRACDAELGAIKAALAEIGRKATSMRSQVKSSDSAVSSHVKKLAGVVQNVTDADRKLQSIEASATSGGSLGKLLKQVPVVGPTILAPIASLIVQMLWLALVVIATLCTLSAMLVVPKAPSV